MDGSPCLTPAKAIADQLPPNLGIFHSDQIDTCCNLEHMPSFQKHPGGTEKSSRKKNNKKSWGGGTLRAAIKTPGWSLESGSGLASFC